MCAAEVSGLDVSPALGVADIALVRILLLEYAASLSVDLCFQGFEEELATLPGKYTPPRGRLLLARSSGNVIGCIALRPLSDTDAEMKRLYLQPKARGQGAGRRLVEVLISEARTAGYRRILLDTLPEMTQAQRLYSSAGFIETAPYGHNSPPGTKFFQLTLL